MKDITQRLANLSPAKRALLEQQLQKKALKNKPEIIISRRINFQEAPLSYSQEPMWLLDQLEPGNSAYNRPTNISLIGKLNVAALEQSLNEIIRRHQILRTSFDEINGKPFQKINPNITLKIPIVELSDIKDENKEIEVQKLAIEEAQQTFDLTQTPLIKAKLVQLNEQEHILLLTMHHIVFDGWSMGVLLKELGKLYEAFSTDKPSPLPELSIQYADFAVWQRQQQQTEKLESQLSYWKKQLGGKLPVLELPTDRGRAAVQTFRGAKHSLLLPNHLVASLKALSLKENVTLFMTLLAAFQILLYRYTSQEDIIVGTPIAGRNSTETEKLIGVFINTLVLRTQLDSNFTFTELLAQVREVALGAYAHQDVPFEKLVEKLKPERNLSHHPLFQVLFQLRNLPEETIEVQDLKFESYHLETGIALLDLALEIEEQVEGLLCVFKFNTDLFDGSTIERMGIHFQTLLEVISEHPQQQISQLSLLSESERHQLLIEWNDTAKDYPKDKCIHQLFEEQVERTPNAVAVVFEDEQLTYQQLNQRANQLAHYLQTIGVKPEVLVGICVERSIEMVVGILGILKAAGAYVPLDPNYPQERLNFMLADSGVEALLTQSSLLESLPPSQARVVCLDTDWQEIEQHSQENPHSGVIPDNLAYVIYTSGSTGKPKGVAVKHLSLCNLSTSQINLFNVEASSSILQFASVSFDASVWEMFMALTGGATLILAAASELMPGSDLKRILHQYCVTHVTLPPSVLAVFANNEFPKLSHIIVAGEACSIELVNQWSTNRRFFNAYGPTESTVCATVAILNNDIKKVTIGRPINNIKIYILDEYVQPVPIGVPGEIYIGGDGLARGYLNRPELTNEKFIPNPFTNSKSERLYKTGDLARYLPDGNIEFLGRIDNQVKIRGFRIELGEIESLLNTHPQVNQAVVIVREDIPGHKSLVAYTLTSEKSLTTKQLREFLKSKLPEYMVPSAFVILDKLPLTPNGKVDRKALPTPEFIPLDNEYVAPRTKSEQIIANIFTSVLRVQNIGIHDNFFELGGNSLLATQLISRLREAFTLEIPLRKVFESPTVVQLDQSLVQLGSSSQLNLPPIQPRTQNEQLPLSWAQERLWFLNQLEGSSATYNISRAFRISDNLNVDVLQKALSEIVSRHEVLRTSFQTINGKAIQVIHPETTSNINVVDLQQLPTTESENILNQQIHQEAITPFDLEIAPLIRCSLYLLKNEEYVFLLTMHHIVSDGWSIGVLIQELSSLYQSYFTGEPSPLAELPIQYADFAVWQRKYLSGEILENQLNYWKKQLNGAPKLLQLPTDRPRPTVQTYRGSTKDFTLNCDLTEKLQILSRDSGTTLFMTLYAAFATLLYRYSGQSDIAIGSPIANRNYSEIEPLIGFFVNTLVLRTHFEDNPNFEELLSQVRETTLKAYEHQDVPFEQVVETLQPQRSLAYSPLFQVMFVLQNTPLEHLELPGATWSELNQHSTIAKFDLTLSMTQTESELVGLWRYNTDLFDRETIERMVGHFQTLLEGIAENPQQQISQLPLLSESEKHQLLIEWNDTATDYSQNKCIHQLFEQQVERTPNAVAVVFENQHLTYQQLNQKANQLAHHLQSLGVKPEVLVGICVERSIEMVVGILGILKAGGAYVPLDPAYPAQRLAYIIEDAKVSVLLTQSKWISQLPENQARIVCLDSDWQKIALCNRENPNSTNTGKNLAYAIYTSGSTGKPKGVTITHRNLSIFTQSAISDYHITNGDRVLQFASINFDAAVEEIYPCLCVGGTLVLRSEEMLADARTFFQACQDLELTVLDLPTAYWHQLVSQLANTDVCLPETLRLIVIGGEKVLLESVRIWQRYVKQFCKHQKLQLINTYGPTETTVSATLYKIGLSNSSKLDEIPIGNPLSHVKTYILDQHLQPVPIGVVGELHIGGESLAKGYLNRGELTREKFIANPFSNSQSERLYKTGDLARYLPDGNIIFIGRIDNQVKIRGFRIELGEIESVLNTHPQVNQAVVIDREDIPSDKRLVAYLVIKNESLSTKQLREFLKSKLPEYMVPSTFVTLDKLPLTLNGKVDRKALPAPDISSIQLENFVPPSNPTEEILANTWADILSIEKVGIHDNFFELGGHSLLATQVISRARQAFSLEIPLKSLFEKPTISGLSDSIQTLLWLKESQEVTTNTTDNEMEEIEL